MWKRPESVLVVVVAAAGGEALLLRRHQPENFWQSVTGSLRAGETPAAAANRELLEETGLRLLTRATGRVVEYPIHPAWRQRYAPGTDTNREHQFFCILPAAVPIARARDEHRGYAWLDMPEALRRVSSQSNRDALDEMRKRVRVLT